MARRSIPFATAFGAGLTIAVAAVTETPVARGERFVDLLRDGRLRVPLGDPR